jgi:hypothetical protein
MLSRKLARAKLIFEVLVVKKEKLTFGKKLLQNGKFSKNKYVLISIMIGSAFCGDYDYRLMKI